MSPMWLPPTWLVPSALTCGCTAMSAGQVGPAWGGEGSSVFSRPPCQEKNQPCPSVVAPCDRVSALAPRNSSVLTWVQVVLQVVGFFGAAAFALVTPAAIVTAATLIATTRIPPPLGRLPVSARAFDALAGFPVLAAAVGLFLRAERAGTGGLAAGARGQPAGPLLDQARAEADPALAAAKARGAAFSARAICHVLPLGSSSRGCLLNPVWMILVRRVSSALVNGTRGNGLGASPSHAWQLGRPTSRYRSFPLGRYRRVTRYAG